MPFQHRFFNVLAPFWKAKIAPKSIKNRSKLSFRAFLFPHCFEHRLLSEFCSQLRLTGSQKTVFFRWKNKVFPKNRLSKITSISASILVPTCLHVGLQNRRFFEIMAFQEAFKISSFFASIFYRFWVRLGLQHGAILGAKTAQNSKKMGSKNVGGRILRRLCFWASLKTVLASILGGQGSSF